MKAFALGLAAALLCAPAWADDSSASLSAGGLVFTKQADIRMAVEELSISPTRVTVRYEFVNDGKRDVDTIVAFPMPDIDVRAFWYEPLGTTLDQTPNFMGFKLKVDGKPVAATPDERAVLDGSDVTATIRKAGLPINIAGSDLVKKLDTLDPAIRKALEKQSLVEMDGNEAHPHWIAKTSFWWHQKFPAGKTVAIEHSYQPVTGQSFFGTYSLQGEEGARNRKTFCIDDGTAAAIRAKVAARDKNGPNGDYLQAFETGFVLKTANNWKGPIGRFRLTVDKLKPGNLVSLCWDGKLRKTGATKFEAAQTGFAPTHDIKLLVLQ